MLKKLFIASAILVTTNSFAISAPYLGASLGIVDNTSSNSSFRGVPLTISGGFGGTINQTVYLAGEIYGILGTSTLDNNANGYSVKTTYGYGLSFIPGFLLSDHTMAFLRLGIAKARFTTLGKTPSGGQIGVGIQTNISQSWDLRGEYDYTSYQKISGVSPRSDAFNIGLVYKFE